MADCVVCGKPAGPFSNAHPACAAAEAARPKASIAPRKSQLPERSTPRTHEYKVLTQRDRFFRESFDPEKLEEALNSYAARGWRVLSIATASISGGLTGSRDELIVVFERAVAAHAPSPQPSTGNTAQ